MSLKTKVPVSEELLSVFQNARDNNTRYFKIVINNEQFEFVSSEPQSGTSSIDFKKVPAVLNDSDPCIILYREKDFNLPSPWVLIVYVPDVAPVNLKMLYASSKGSLKDGLGRNLFGKNKEFSTVDEVVWKNVQMIDLVSNDDPKPWSQREVSLNELEEQENQSRIELMNNPQTQPSGFNLVRMPLTNGAEQALRSLSSKQVNWVQLTLGDNFEQINCVISKTISDNELADNIDFTQPQFYLFDLGGNIILIYCCPDEGTNIRNRMVYSTCKAGLAEQIRSFGVSVVKKFDIRSRDEVNLTNLRTETSRKVALRFSPTTEMLRGTNRNNNEDRNTNVRSSYTSNTPPRDGSPTIQRIMGGDKKTSKRSSTSSTWSIMLSNDFK